FPSIAARSGINAPQQAAIVSEVAATGARFSSGEGPQQTRIGGGRAFSVELTLGLRARPWRSRACWAGGEWEIGSGPVVPGAVEI
ncbi:MAG TPA: hypothetical protein VG815_10280, partial [Chloroflexota bacterium]|nr:hypothetical protein [Chloroflexota bacterium]